MKRSSLSLLLAAASLLVVAAGCGGHTKKTTKQDAPATPAKSEPVPVTAPAKPASVPSSTPVAPPVRSEAPNKPDAAPAVKAPETKPVEAKPSLQAEGAADFTKGYMKGKKIEEWITSLDSKNKEEVSEAINVCALAGSKKALPKLEELSKSADKDIADDAKFAINRINNAGK